MSAQVRLVIGLVGAVIMLLSSVPHSMMGWPAQRQVLLQAQVPASTILGLSVGWHFGGVAIAVFGFIAAVSFLQVLRGHAPHMRATTVIGMAYTGFGIWAWLVTREAYALSFVVPGLLVLAGAVGHRR